MLVAPSTSTRASWVLTPCICTRNSVLMRRAASLSLSERELHRASICGAAGLRPLSNHSVAGLGPWVVSGRGCWCVLVLPCWHECWNGFK